VTTLSRLHCVGPGTHEERQISHFKCKSCIPAVVVPRFRASLRANINETILPVVITEQGENRNQCEEQWNLFGSCCGVARRGA